MTRSHDASVRFPSSWAFEAQSRFPPLSNLLQGSGYGFLVYGVQGLGFQSSESSSSMSLNIYLSRNADLHPLGPFGMKLSYGSDPIILAHVNQTAELYVSFVGRGRFQL